MRARAKVQLLGGLCLAAAVPALFLLPTPFSWLTLAGLALVGAFLLLVVAERVVPVTAVEAAFAGDTGTLASLRRGFALEGPLYYVPDQGNIGGERMFLAAARNARAIPTLDADTATYLGTGGSKAGLAVAPAGAALVDQHARDMEVTLPGATVDAVEGFLQGLASRHDLAQRLSAHELDGAIHVRFSASAVEPPCFRDPATPACATTGCALCQAVGCALARAKRETLVVAAARVERPWIELELRAEDAT